MTTASASYFTTDTHITVTFYLLLLESFKLSHFYNNMIDGPTLINYKSFDDVKELDNDIVAKVRILFNEIIELKSTEVIWLYH